MARTPVTGTGRVRVRRHALLLVPAAAASWRLARPGGAGIGVWFAATGGVYALAWVLALRRPVPPWRAAGVVVLAGVLNVATEWAGRGLVGGLGAPLGAAVPLACAGGAAGFGLLLHASGFAALGARRILVLAGVVAAAATVASLRFGLAGPTAVWRVSMVWWIACSAVLCGYDRRVPDATS